jgi:hypothetical protein
MENVKITARLPLAFGMLPAIMSLVGRLGYRSLDRANWFLAHWPRCSPPAGGSARRAAFAEPASPAILCFLRFSQPQTY